MSIEEPLDPMWVTFRRAHPEVTLILLPEDASEAPPSPAKPDTSGDDARATLAAMARRVDLVVATLGLAGASRAGWQHVDDATVRPHVQWRATGENAIADAEFISARLSTIGWDTQVRSTSDPLLIDATIGDTLARLIGTEDGFSIRVSGEPLCVGHEVCETLRGETGGESLD